MAIPMAYIAANNKLADVAVSTEVAIWKNADQPKASWAAARATLSPCPHNAATFYTKACSCGC